MDLAAADPGSLALCVGVHLIPRQQGLGCQPGIVGVGLARRMRTSKPAAPRIRHRVSTEGDLRPDSYADIAAWLVPARLASAC